MSNHISNKSWGSFRRSNSQVLAALWMKMSAIMLDQQQQQQQQQHSDNESLIEKLYDWHQ